MVGDPVKLTLTLELDATDEQLVHPRIAGALVDYAAAVIKNNQAVMRDLQATDLAGDPPVGLTHTGQLRTAHGVLITEAVEI